MTGQREFFEERHDAVRAVPRLGVSQEHQRKRRIVDPEVGVVGPREPRVLETVWLGEDRSGPPVADPAGQFTGDSDHEVRGPEEFEFDFAVLERDRVGTVLDCFVDERSVDLEDERHTKSACSTQAATMAERISFVDDVETRGPVEFVQRSQPHRKRAFGLAENKRLDVLTGSRQAGRDATQVL